MKGHDWLDLALLVYLVVMLFALWYLVKWALL